MTKIENLRCSLCGEKHNNSLVTELITKGWYVTGISKNGGNAKRLICPECLQRIYGRKLRKDEFKLPE